MNFKIFDYLENLEKRINDGISINIFRGYKAINKHGIEKIIDDIYANLPEDIMNAKAYLKTKEISLQEDKQKDFSQKNIFDSLKKLEISISTFVLFADIVIINIKEIEKLIDKIYENIPEVIKKAKNLDE